MSNECNEAVEACEFCKKNELHPLFLYLITDSRVQLTNINSKTQSYVGLSSSPLTHTMCQNRAHGFRAGIKLTKLVSPHWELQLVIPIYQNAKLHKNAYKKFKTNRLKLLLMYLCELAIQQNTPIYAKDPSVMKAIITAKQNK